ncbi:MAG: hypothetical protein NC337_06990 [Roseburia sp.]|nr:hypothetical protein [Roseburia sp.]
MLKKLLRFCISRCGLLHIPCAFCREMIRGYRVYKRIKRRTGGAKLFLQYYPGTGDVYLSAAYLRYCEERENAAGNSVFVVNGANAAGVAALTGPERIPVVALPGDKAYSLVQLTRFIGTDAVDIKYLHYMSDWPMYTSFLITLAGLHGLGFMELYREIAFDGERFELPAPRWSMGRESYPPASGRERRALLAPAANSIAQGPDSLFWRELARRLKQSGYRVYTNVSGDERPIAGTEPAFIPYKELALFLDERAVFIGYRSGLCDLAASLKCRKIILYPKSGWPVINGLRIASTLEIFSLSKMGLCEDAVELEYSEQNELQILSEILENTANGRGKRINI